MESTHIFEVSALIMQISVYSRKTWFLFSSFHLFYELLFEVDSVGLTVEKDIFSSFPLPSGVHAFERKAML